MHYVKNVYKVLPLRLHWLGTNGIICSLLHRQVHSYMKVVVVVVAAAVVVVVVDVVVAVVVVDTIVVIAVVAIVDKSERTKQDLSQRSKVHPNTAGCITAQLQYLV